MGDPGDTEEDNSIYRYSPEIPLLMNSINSSASGRLWAVIRLQEMTELSGAN